MSRLSCSTEIYDIVSYNIGFTGTRYALNYFIKWGILNFPQKKSTQEAQKPVGTGEVNSCKRQRKGRITGSGEGGWPPTSPGPYLTRSGKKMRIRPNPDLAQCSPLKILILTKSDDFSCAFHFFKYLEDKGGGGIPRHEHHGH
jgi:hypothetical protein